MTPEELRTIFRRPPEIGTERLILTKLVADFASDMFEYASDPVVTKYLTWPPHSDVRETRRYLRFVRSKYKSGEYYDFAVVERATGKMIGTCGFTGFDLTANSAEVGYAFNREYWGRGLAAEALSAVVRFGFRTLGLNRIEAKYIVGNERSLRVMEKVGMTFEGVLRDSMFVRGRTVSVGVASILRREYRG